MVDLKWVGALRLQVGEHDKIEVGREDLNLKHDGEKVKVMGIS